VLSSAGVPLTTIPATVAEPLPGFRDGGIDPHSIAMRLSVHSSTSGVLVVGA